MRDPITGKNDSPKKPYRSRRRPRTTVEFSATVLDDDGEEVTVSAVGLELALHEFNALDALLIGEVSPFPDASGKSEMKARRIKLRHILDEVSNLDPEAYEGGRVKRGPALSAWIDDEGNDTAVYVLWGDYVGALSSPRRKSPDPGDRAPDGDGEGGTEGQDPTGSRVSAVSGASTSGD